MKIRTKLWKRSNTSFATTVPKFAVLLLDLAKNYDVEWEYDKQKDEWRIRLIERKGGEKHG